ncbi:MAG: cytochrome c oxidase subunit 3 [Bacteriovoracaceae bacterium]|nr:cytochrome c oxidase subunit 3 [Bacteriovoracaceae bacterium]
MSRVATLDSAELEGRRLASSIAMTVVLVSFSMLFASLFLGYAYYRITSPVWPPMGMSKVDLYFPTLSTFAILLSSLSFVIFKTKYLGGGSAKKTLPWLGLTIFLGLGFMFTQFSLWADLSGKGFYASSGVFQSLVYAFTWIHAAHIVMAILALVWLVPTTLKNECTITEENKVNNIGKFWHFLGVIWLLMYFIIFVI